MESKFCFRAPVDACSSREVVNDDGDNIEEGGRAYPEINCVRLHIPYPMLGDRPGQHYFPLALAIAERIGWTAYDDQSGEPIPRASGRAQSREHREAVAEVLAVQQGSAECAVLRSVIALPLRSQSAPRVVAVVAECDDLIVVASRLLARVKLA